MYAGLPECRLLGGAVTSEGMWAEGFSQMLTEGFVGL